MNAELELLWQLLLATGLGGFIGLERGLAGKTAGLRTHALVSLGAALFSLMSISAFDQFIGVTNYDPSRIASQVVVGVGFIGAGIIILGREKVRGLTTAAGLWVAAAIGMAVAYKFYVLAISAVIVTLIVFVIFWHLEEYLEKRFSKFYRE